MAEIRKWQYIAKQLKMMNAPKKVVFAAKEIDRILYKLGLGWNTRGWEDYITSEYLRHSMGIIKKLDKEELYWIIVSKRKCTACENVNPMNCTGCMLGSVHGCTPRSKYADDYFRIVVNWIKKK